MNQEEIAAAFPECAPFLGVPHQYQNCTHQRLTPEKCDRWRVAQGLEPKAALPEGTIVRKAYRLSTPTREPVGTIFRDLVESLKVPKPEGCDCEALEVEMNFLGIKGCQRDRERLLTGIRANANKVSWIARVHAIGPAIAQGLAFSLNPFDPAPGLFDEALRIAAEEEKKKRRPSFITPNCCGKNARVKAPAKQRRTSHVRHAGPLAMPPAGDPLTLFPFTGRVIRHLHYYCWPVAQNGTWQHNLNQLIRRMDLFNGRRRMAIATSPNADPPEAVQEYVKDHGFEFMIVPNNPKKREVEAFLPLLAPLESRNPNETIFFAHAKGVSHGAWTDENKVEHKWASAMYDTLLDDWPAVEAMLLYHTFVGSFRKFNQFRSAGHHRWHYAGTYYWARSARVFATRWNRIENKYWGSETWPGLLVPSAHSACIFHDNTGGIPRRDYWDEKIAPDLVAWKRAHHTEARHDP